MNAPARDLPPWSKTLLSLMEKHDLNQIQLAEISGVKQSTIQRILSGETGSPRTDTLRKIVLAMGEDFGIFGVGTDTWSLAGEFRDAGKAEVEAYRTAREAVREGRITEDELVLVVRALCRRRDPPTS